MKAWVNELKTGPCHDCGRRFPPYAMDFDHLDASEKSFEISRALRVATAPSRRRILAEIKKCHLVCACCHRIRTHHRHLSGALKVNPRPRRASSSRSS